LGELYDRVDETVARATLETAWEKGVRYYDTAPLYGRGLSEHRIGGFLRTRPRADFAVTTKVGRILRRPPDPAHFDRSPWSGGLNFDIEYDYTREGFMRSYEQSLQRLALDTIDALVIHDIEEPYHGDKLPSHIRHLTSSGIHALEELKRAGDIKAYGMGINTLVAFDQTAPLVELDFCLVAMPYTLLDQQSLYTGMARCLREGISVIIGAPFASGILVTGSTVDTPHYAYGRASEEIRARVRRLERVCASFGVPLAAAALQFVLAHPAVVSVVPGAVNSLEVEQNLEYLEFPIPDGFWISLRAEGLILSDAPTPGGTLQERG
jgi:D-threo-aldose 1-dehydrogenase